MTSSRASNSTPQEVTAFFNATGGMRYITDVVLSNSAETVAPFGEWYFAYYNNGITKKIQINGLLSLKTRLLILDLLIYQKMTLLII
jgi:hypothetical protein